MKPKTPYESWCDAMAILRRDGVGTPIEVTLAAEDWERMAWEFSDSFRYFDLQYRKRIQVITPVGTMVFRKAPSARKK